MSGQREMCQRALVKTANALSFGTASSVMSTITALGSSRAALTMLSRTDR
jgi:hypothetical protein